jgi:hypothetical protein
VKRVRILQVASHRNMEIAGSWDSRSRVRWPCQELEDGLQQIGHARPEERNQRGYSGACSILSRSTGVSSREIFNDTES